MIIEGDNFQQCVDSNMAAVSVRNFLDSHAVPYEDIACQPALTLEQLAQQQFIPLSQFARATLLRAGAHYLMAILPVGNSVDLQVLKTFFAADYELAWPDEYEGIFGMMHTGTIPPLADMFDVDCVMDTSFADGNSIYMPDGTGRRLVRLASADFNALQTNARRLPFSIDNMVEASIVPQGTAPMTARVRAREMHAKVERLDSLPVLPETAAELLRLSANPESMPEDVAHIIERDSTIAAQVMRYARSPWYAYPKDINTLEEAIFSVLGIDMVINLALGLSAGKSFAIPKSGALGSQMLWRHSVYAAALASVLARASAKQVRVKPGTAYLAGLLHNIGFNILGHCFKEEYDELAAMLERHSDTPVWQIEKKLFGLTHAEIGAELMRRWDLPQSIIRVIRYHHDTHYVGKSRAEVMLVLLANRLLGGLGIGDESENGLPQEALDYLGIDASTAIQLRDNLLAGCDALDAMARYMAA